MIYIASPYSHEDPAIRDSRYHAVLEFTADALAKGYIAYSPIAHCHDMAVRFALPTSFDFWEKYNFGMLRLASELWVLELDGWKESKGVQAEIAFARLAHIPVVYWMKPDGEDN